MTDKKWGGKREGAGRPKGTNNKKQYTFRLSQEELSAVRELLAKMRGKLVIFFCLLALCLPVNAQTLQGSINYTVDTAKKEAFEGIYKWCPFPDKESLSRSTYVYNFDENNILSKEVLENNLIRIIYKDYPNFAYTYKIMRKNAYNTLGGYTCISVSVNYGNKVATYHALRGKLMGVRFIVSPDEEYMFDMSGNLIGHRIGNKLQKEKLNIRKITKVIYSAQ